MAAYFLQEIEKFGKLQQNDSNEPSTLRVPQLDEFAQVHRFLELRLQLSASSLHQSVLIFSEAYITINRYSSN